MDTPLEEQEPQNPPEGSAPAAEEVTISKTELDELKHKAEVSSQNFERAKKAEKEAKELQEELKTYTETPSELGDDELGKVKSELSEIKGKLNKSEVISSYPILKESWDEFEEFRSSDENKGMNMRTAAKAFLTEKGLLEPIRKGLEKPTGGPRVPISSGMSVEEVKHLRENDFKKYQVMLLKGQIKIADK